MNLINFQNGITQANAETMTQFQNNIANAMSRMELLCTVGDYSAVDTEIELNDSIANYDLIVVSTGYVSDNTYISTILTPFNLGVWVGGKFRVPVSDGNYIGLECTDNNTLKIISRTTGSIRQIKGIKL